MIASPVKNTNRGGSISTKKLTGSWAADIGRPGRHMSAAARIRWRMRHYGVEMGWHRTIEAIAANAGERRLVDQTGVESAFSVGFPESRQGFSNEPCVYQSSKPLPREARYSHDRSTGWTIGQALGR